MRAAEEPGAATMLKQSLKQSPRKSIDAFLQATPPKVVEVPQVEPASSANSSVSVDQAPKEDATKSLLLPAAALAVVIVAVLIAQMM